MRQHRRCDLIDRLVIETVLKSTVDQLAIVSGTLKRSFLAQSSLSKAHAELAGAGSGPTAVAPGPSQPAASSSSANAAAGGTETVPAVRRSTSGNFAVAADVPVLVHWNTTDRPLAELLLKEQKDNKKHQARSGAAGDKIRSMALLASQADYARSVLEDTLAELRQGGSFTALLEAVEISRRRIHEKSGIREAEIAAREEQVQLRDLIEKAKKDMEADMSSAGLDIARLKDELLETRRVTRGEEAFIEELEVVQEEEQLNMFSRVEEELVKTKDRLKIELGHEQRVAMEAEGWLRRQQQRLEGLHREWTGRLEQEVAEKRAEFRELVEVRQRDKARLEDAGKAIAETQEYVRHHVAKRKEDRAAKELMRLKIKMAIRIQSWWRMVMVRRCLGPYKRRKKQMQAAKEKAAAARKRR